MADTSQQLVTELHEIHTFLREVHSKEQWSNHPVKVTAISFAKGVAYGMGIIAAAAIVAPFVLWFLRSVAWPPLISTIVTDVIHQMEQASPRVQPAVDGL